MLFFRRKVDLGQPAAAALPLAVASARRVAETLPEGMLEGLEKSTRVALKTRPKPIAALADARSLACIDGETYARRGPATRTLRKTGAAQRVIQSPATTSSACRG